MSKRAIILDSSIVKLQRRLMGQQEDNQTRLELARAFNIRAMHAEALEQSRRVLDADPGVGGAWLEAIRATFHIDERQIPALREEFIASTANHEDETWRRRSLALLHFYGGEEGQAREILDSLVGQDGVDSRSWEILGNIHFHGGAFDEAIRCLEQAVEHDAANVTAYHLLGTCFYQLRESEKTLFYYQKAIRLEEKFARAWISLGEFFLFDNGGYSKALQCFGRATSINPYNWDAYFFLIDNYIQTRRYELAQAECLRILELGPENRIRAEACNYLGYLQFKQGQEQEAETSYREALSLDPDFASPHQNLGLLYLSRKEIDLARIHFKRAIRLDPSIAWSHTKLGFIYLDERVLERAEAHFNQARVNDPDDFWSLLGLAEVYRLRRKYKKQLECCLRAAELQPEHTNVWNHLGIAYECNRRYRKAEATYRKAMDLDPFNRWAANNLGYLYEKLLKRKNDESYRDKAIDIWKKRLQICSRTGASVRGATRHLIKLGIPKERVESWLME